MAYDTLYFHSPVCALGSGGVDSVAADVLSIRRVQIELWRLHSQSVLCSGFPGKD